MVRTARQCVYHIQPTYMLVQITRTHALQTYTNQLRMLYLVRFLPRAVQREVEARLGHGVGRPVGDRLAVTLHCWNDRGPGQSINTSIFHSTTTHERLAYLVDEVIALEGPDIVEIDPRETLNVPLRL